VAAGDGTSFRTLPGFEGTLELIRHSWSRGEKLASTVARLQLGPTVSLAELETDQSLLPPIGHAEPTRLLISGTGLTHFGSAEARDRMHQAAHHQAAGASDSMKMFLLGLEGGKPATPDAHGVQPEWFYKGTGNSLVPPGGDFEVPGFHLSVAEEPEIVSIYAVDSSGQVWRVGYALGNDLSDHVTEQSNYLYLAHSKLLPCSIGPELVVGDLPPEIFGQSRVIRENRVLWSGDFASGEANMCHSLRNLEEHHFKYPRHRVPDTVHAHFLGCPVMSFNAGIRVQSGDVLEIEVPLFGHPLRNRVTQVASVPPEVRAL
jgi:hypothetical protein